MSGNNNSVLRKISRFWHRLVRGSLRDISSPAPWAVLPDGFQIRTLANTGVRVVDNFCTADEAKEIIDVASDRLERSLVMTAEGFRETDLRSSDHALLFGPRYRYQGVIPLMRRAAALVGLPYTHLEEVYVTRYGEKDFYGQHIDYGDDFGIDRHYTVLLYLNTVPEEQGGATVFPSLKAAVQPLVGRAVTWTNKNPDGSGHLESNHAAFPVKNGGEKWVIQFWFRRYRIIDPMPRDAEDGIPVSEPLRGDERLPDGVHFN
jgi:hypothetical protein